MKDSLKNKNIIVLYGGVGVEKEVSLSSGEGIIKALKSEGYSVVPYIVDGDITSLISFLERNKKNAVVFNAMHGYFGEDGKLQAILDYLKIPYTHSGIIVTSLFMDKVLTKKVVKSLGIKVVKDQILKPESLKENLTISYPFVIKPYNEGSSVSVFLINNELDLDKAIEKITGKYKVVMVEEYIKGSEYTVGVLDGKALAVTEIIANNNAFYDYSSKYSDKGSKHILPANVSKNAEGYMVEAAEKIYKEFNAKGVIRLDFRGEDDNIYLLEVNTHPGFTSTSLLPEQALYKNINFLSLVENLLELADIGD